MNTIEKSNQLAKQMCAGNYRYLYGAKGQAYTKQLVNKLATSYPDVYTENVKAEALKDADKGYIAIDCSGFVCDVLGVSASGSANMKKGAIALYSVSKANAKEGMAIWKNGHIAYIGEGLKIYEAASTKSDMRVSEFDSRANAFTALIIVKGSALASTGCAQATAAKAGNPYTEPTGTVKYIEEDENTVKESVKWLQWELNEAGYNLKVDGKYGPKTLAALKAYQASCKIEVDGKCGPDTRAHLKAA
jgi:hypothetical protein